MSPCLNIRDCPETWLCVPVSVEVARIAAVVDLTTDGVGIIYVLTNKPHLMHK